MVTAKGRSKVLIWALVATVPVMASAADQRTFAAGYAGVEFQGMPMFFPKSVEGGAPIAPPVVHGQRPDRYPDKEPGPIKYEDAQLKFGLQAPKGFWDWANAFASPQAGAPKQVTLTTYDFNLVERGRRVLDNATMSLLELPACDGASKDPAYLTVGLTPGAVREVAPTGAKSSAAPGGKVDQKWLASNFKLTIEGVDTSRVSKIDPITIKRTATGPEYSNLKIEVSDAGIASWKQWAAQTFGAPNEKGLAAARVVGSKSEKNGKLELLAPNMKDTLFTINFEGLGIVEVVPSKSESSDSIQRTSVELYVEKITMAVAP